MTTSNTRWLRRISAFTCFASIAIIATGCHVTNPHKPTDPSQASQTATALESLPSLEATHQQVQSAIEQLGQQITLLAPNTHFEWRREDSRTGCVPPYEQSNGKIITLRNYVSDAPVPEQNWPQVQALAQQTAQTMGLTNVTVFKDTPNNHDVQFSDETGTALRLGSKDATVITGKTGCPPASN